MKGLDWFKKIGLDFWILPTSGADPLIKRIAAFVSKLREDVMFIIISGQRREKRRRISIIPLLLAELS